MTKIFRSDVRIGNFTCIEDNPCVSILRDHVYCPSNLENCVPGVFDLGRKIINYSHYSRGPIPSDIFPARSMPIQYNDVHEYGEEDTYIFLGEIHNHFGHFLLSTLSRLWQIRTLPEYKIIINAGAHLRVQQDHFRLLLEAFGVDIRRLWSPDRPTKIRQLILPYPSFEERNFVHKAFARSFNEAGDKILRENRFNLSGNGPIYLSKSKMQAGVRKIMNEFVVEERLSAAGYTIVHPEILPIADQLAVWRQNRPIVAFNGSSLHSSAFSKGGQIVSFGWDRLIDTSFLLCDWANDSRSDYFYFESSAMSELGPSSDHFHGIVGLSSRIELADPLGAAEAIMRAVDVSTAAPRINLSRGRPTTQSSIYIEGDYDASNLSATSGKLTGRYQFCTEHEMKPWLQIDLESECEIEEIKLYNRTDAGEERSSQFVISLSSMPDDFRPVFSRQSSDPFGGLNGEPFTVSLDQAQRGRFVRISIPGTDFLHLDQVEIYGRAISLDEPKP